MSVLRDLKPEKVFKFFEEICSIPHGSYNMKPIADYCERFAKERGLRVVRDEADNIIIFKDGMGKNASAEPIILQGHLDMVCQKTPDCDINFETDGLKLFLDGDFLKAKGTTLGADNGIAVSMILSILDSCDLSHPPIEAVFTTDEEVGMVGAAQLDTSILKSTRMVNLDSEDMDCMTVSCAGGSDFEAVVPIARTLKKGTEYSVEISGLKGGHSGVTIHEGRVNANTLAGRILMFLNSESDASVVDIAGGDKGNAIPNACEIKIISNDQRFEEKLTDYIKTIKAELFAREPEIDIKIKNKGENSADVLTEAFKLIFPLVNAPNGVIDMSAEIDGLVETSLNLGILKSEEDRLIFRFALRSNKKTALFFLEQRLTLFFANLGADISVGSFYPPWEFNPDSELQKVYIESYTEFFGEMPKVEAIHAGLECAVFADKLKGFDGIAIGPQMYDVHTTAERLSVSSTEQIYKLLIKLLEKC